MLSKKETKSVLCFVASKGSRIKGGPVFKFIKKNLNSLKEYKLVATSGTYNNLLEPYKKVLDVEPVKPGYSGGVIELASKIVNGECQTVIFFSDSEDHWASSFENQTLVRQCIVHNVELLQNIWGARIWAEKNHDCIKIPFSKQRVALIAHDAKKGKMLEFVGNNIDVLSHFEKIITTGTTGTQIKSLFPIIADKIFPMESGPLGGDCQIANEIIEGRCQHAIFFIDPLNPHPHAVDIQLFVRVCQQLKGVDVNFLVTEKSAWRWVETVRNNL